MVKQAFHRQPKIIGTDYDWILSQTGECEVCLTMAQIQMIYTILDYWHWPTRWYSASETPIDQDTIDALADDLARRLFMACCGDDEVRIYHFTEYGVYEVSTDEGVTWETEPDDPRITAPVLTTLPGEPGEIMRCSAAENIISIMQQTKTNTVNSLSEELPTLLAVITAILAIISVILALVTFGILAPLVVSFAAAIIAAGGAALDDALTPDTFQIVKCILFNNVSNDGTVTEEQWITIQDEIIAQVTNPLAQQFYLTIVRALGARGLTSAGRTGVSDADECGCDDTWCHIFDFETGQHDWEILNIGGFGDFGRYVAETGFLQNIDYTPVDAISLLNLGWSSVITRFVAEFDPEMTGSFKRFALFQGNLGETIDESSLGGTTIEFEWPEGVVITDGVSVDIDPYVGGQEFSAMCLKFIRIEGTGTNPFSINNCEE